MERGEGEVTRNEKLFGNSRVELNVDCTKFTNLALVCLKFEPFILHVRASSLDSAQKLLQVALQSGFANSGLVVGKNTSVMVQIKSPLKMDSPIGYYSEQEDKYYLVVGREYLKFVVGLGMEKFDLNTRRMELLLSNIAAFFNSNTSIDSV